MGTKVVKHIEWRLPKEIEGGIASMEVLEEIYVAAGAGLKGDILAIASGMTPTCYKRLKKSDPNVELVEQKGRADGELRHANNLMKAADGGDAKAALAILQHVHGWTSKQEISLNVNSISIVQALEDARGRVLEDRKGRTIENGE